MSGFVSCRRIEKYLSLAEIEPVEDYTGNGDIVLTNATLTWPQDESAKTLNANPENRVHVGGSFFDFPTRQNIAHLRTARIWKVPPSTWLTGRSGSAFWIYLMSQIEA